MYPNIEITKYRKFSKISMDKYLAVQIFVRTQGLVQMVACKTSTKKKTTNNHFPSPKMAASCDS